MFQKSKSDCIAVIAEDSDTLLFCKCVLEANFSLDLFLNSCLDSLSKKIADFAFVIVDMKTAEKLSEQKIWSKFSEKFRARLFVLARESQVDDFGARFSADAVLIPFPFTSKILFGILSKSNSQPKNPKEQIATYLENAPSKNEIKVSSPSCPERFECAEPKEFSMLVGASKKISDIKTRLLLVSDTDCPLIFFGESGSGKTLMAGIVHKLSRRRENEFIVANMANNNRNLIESELFGSVSGAFTDAKNRHGLFKRADGGTLFMDEIAELPLDCQAKLLRVIETCRFRPVGSDTEVSTNTRMIFATSADLQERVRRKQFREDLYWRIVDFPIQVPALRERAEDIPALIEQNLIELRRAWNIDFQISAAACEKLRSYDWPGNIRQFKACLRRAAILCRHTQVIDFDAIIF